MCRRRVIGHARCLAPLACTSSGPTVTARATLIGHELDLAALAELFPAGDPRVIRDGEETALEASALDDPLDAKDGARLVEIAGDYLKRMNGVAALRDASFRQVALANQFHRDSHRHIMITDEARGRDSLAVVFAEVRMSGAATMSVGGVPAALPPEGPQRLASAAAHPDADELLALIGRSTRWAGIRNGRPWRSSAKPSAAGRRSWRRVG